MNDLILKKINGKDVLFNLNKNKHYIEMYFIIIVSIIFGVLVSKNESKVVSSYLTQLFSNYYNNGEIYSFFNIFLNSLSSSFVYLFLLFVFGTCTFGCFFTPIIIFIKAIGYGLLSGFLYSNYQLKGVCFYLLVVLPGAILLLTGFVLAGKESYEFSLLFFKLLKKDSKPIKFNEDFKSYSLRFLIIFSVMIFSSFVDSLTGKVFLKFFKL